MTFDLSSLTSITWMPQSGRSGVSYNQTLTLNVLTGVRKIAFGLFLSPIYLSLAGPQQGTIPTTPTQLPIAPPSPVIPFSFHVFLPASPMPAGGYPVISIYGRPMAWVITNLGLPRTRLVSRGRQRVLLPLRSKLPAMARARLAKHR